MHETNRHSRGYGSHDIEKSAIDIGRAAADIGTSSHGSVGRLIFILSAAIEIGIQLPTTIHNTISACRVLFGTESSNWSRRRDFRNFWEWRGSPRRQFGTSRIRTGWIVSHNKRSRIQVSTHKKAHETNECCFLQLLTLFYHNY